MAVRIWRTEGHSDAAILDSLSRGSARAYSGGALERWDSDLRKPERAERTTPATPRRDSRPLQAGEYATADGQEPRHSAKRSSTSGIVPIEQTQRDGYGKQEHWRVRRWSRD